MYKFIKSKYNIFDISNYHCPYTLNNLNNVQNIAISIEHHPNYKSFFLLNHIFKKKTKFEKLSQL